MRKLKVGIVGSNYGAKVIFPALTGLPTIDLKGYGTTSNQESQKRLCGLAENKSIERVSLEYLLNELSCDLIVVATPPATQIEICKKIMDGGASIFCEKPVGISSSEAISLDSFLQERNSNFYVGFQFRYDLGINWIKSNILQNRIGQIISSEVEWYTSGSLVPTTGINWRDDERLGGGVSRDFCVHIFDYLRYIDTDLFGSLPEFEILKTRKPSGSRAYQELLVIVRYPSVTVKISVSRMVKRKASHKILFKGTRGKLAMKQSHPFSLYQMKLYSSVDRKQEDAHKKFEAVLGKGIQSGGSSDLRAHALRIFFQDIYGKVINNENRNLPGISDAVFAQRCVDKLNALLY
jgi:predicted dehydrogenase